MEEEIVKRSFLVVWIIISSVIFLVLMSPFLLEDEAIYRIAPRCESRVKYNRECVMCGMTTAFIQISRGNLKKASENNRAGIYLYSLFAANNLIFCFFCACWIFRRTKLIFPSSGNTQSIL
ncbi:MAG: DUF2752 domain-containing protein [Ignavibacteriales bacterium]